MRRRPGTVKRTAIVLVGVLLLSPMAAAQDPTGVTVRLQGWQSKLDVGEANEQVTVIIEYPCGRAGPDGSEAEINVTGPSWAMFDGPDNVTLQSRPDECLQSQTTRLTHAVAYSVEVTRQAPALLQENVTFNVTAHFPDSDASDEAEETVSAGFLADIDVAVDPARIEAFAGRTAEHTLTVTNRGNGPIRIAITVPQIDDGLELQVPPSGQAPSPLGDEEPVWQGTLTATGRLPDDVNSGTFNATLELLASYDGENGQETAKRQLNLTAAIERHPSEIEEDGSIPGFEVASIVVAAAVVALARRRHGS